MQASESVQDFSGFLLATGKVASITVIVLFTCNSSSRSCNV